MIKPCNYSIVDTANWVLDTGSPIHVCNSLQGLQVSRRFEDGEQFLSIGNGNRVPVLAVGVLRLVFESCTVELVDCHYCPSFIMSIISVGLLASCGFELSIKEDFCNVILNNSVIMKARLNNGIYVLSRPVSVMYTSSKRPRLDNVNNLYLWHCRLGHINQNRINKMRGDGLLEVSDSESLPTCESCLLGKMTKSPFTGKGE